MLPIARSFKLRYQETFLPACIDIFLILLVGCVWVNADCQPGMLLSEPQEGLEIKLVEAWLQWLFPVAAQPNLPK